MNIIMYHYVRHGSTDLPGLNYLDKDAFLSQIEWFKSNGGLVTLAQLKDLKKGLVDEASAGEYLLSFDDGLQDHKWVAQTLFDMGIAGVFGITTKVLNGKFVPATHLMHRVFGQYEALEVQENICVKDLTRIGVFAKEKLNDKSVYGLHRQDAAFKLHFKTFVNYSPEREDARNILEKTCERLNVSQAQDGLFLSAHDVRELSKMGHLVIAHGHSHENLKVLATNMWQEEITRSLSVIRELGGDPTYFMFPFGGRKSYGDGHLDFLASQGVINAFTVDNRKAHFFFNRSDLEIPRLDCKLFIR